MLATFRPDPLAMAAAQLRAGVRVRQGLARPVFANDEQETFFDSTAAELLYSGWMGAGKSRILCEKAWWLALHYPGSPIGLFRKVRASMTATTERTFWDEVADPQYIVARNKTESWVEVSAGGKPSRIWFLGLDPDPITGTPSKVGSLNLAWAGVDEAIELTEADWTMVGGRVRHQAIPFRQVAAATNPHSPRHWLKRRFTPATAERQYLEASGNRFLPADYLERLAGLGDGVVAQRLGKGLWVAAEGQIYLLPDEQIRQPDQATWRRTVAGIDWGYTHAFACEVVGVSGAGRLATTAELYVRNQTVPQLIPQLKALRDEHHIETFYADPSEPAYIRECREAGLPITEAINDVMPGITTVQAAIAAGMTVSPDCDGLLTEIPDYTWAKDRVSGQPKDAPTKINDDAVDAWRYAVMGATHGAGLLDFYQQLRDEAEAKRKAAQA